MSPIGWEFYGVKFSFLVTMGIAFLAYLSVMLGSKRHEDLHHVDSMAGDEGDE